MQLLDLARALESGVDGNVAYALNALSLAAFSAPEALIPTQRQLLPALISIVRSGLPETFREAESAEPVEEPEEPDFSRPPTAVQLGKWAPKVQISFSGFCLFKSQLLHSMAWLKNASIQCVLCGAIHTLIILTCCLEIYTPRKDPALGHL